ncbi:hypothetical protein [Halorhabdus rudnickae]|uniref:hypothetical protein n=1 Tax=Halorhabdus rudnickae TaxID=1775544 RepID=UPI00108368E5|nr:hypothetical protein [Halorhabdus rudnickae]
MTRHEGEDSGERARCDGGRVPELEDLLDQVDIPDGWISQWDGETLSLTYKAVPLDRLSRRSWPGIDINYIGQMWMLASYDSIGHDLGIDHQGILNHGKTVDCQQLDDAVEATEHGMKRVEEEVGEELDEAHQTGEWPYA